MNSYFLFKTISEYQIYLDKLTIAIETEKRKSLTIKQVMAAMDKAELDTRRQLMNQKNKNETLHSNT